VKEKFDVVIIGAGMVGASFACALLSKQTSLKIALIEVFPLTLSGTGLSSYDDRSTALSSGSSECYSRCGVWEKIRPYGTAIDQIQVSDRYLPGATLLDSKSMGLDALGYVIENRKLGEALLETVLADKGIQCFAPAKVTELKPAAEGSLVHLQMGDQAMEICSQLVVIAEGTESGLRDQLGIRATSHSYDQQAIIANISVDRSHQNIAYERFTEQGPVALLPLQGMAGEDHRFALVLNSQAAESAELMQACDTEFISRLQQRLGYRAGRIIRLGKRALYPLIQSRAHEQVRKGFVILGNAAHTMHPVAGQGFNLSLRDAVELADGLVAAHNQGQDLGSLVVLEDYLANRQTDQALVQEFTHGVVNLFSQRNPLSRLFRQAGLVTMDLLPFIKNEFAYFAAGMNTGIQ
jgi:2-octaprenyl-6-methoxyphenol hydroxylase